MALPPGRTTATAIVTGASSGIGEGIARALARRGRRLTLVARRLDRLEALAAELRQRHDVEVDVQPADLSDRAGRADLLRRIGEVDVLVNNAGFGIVDRYVRMDPRREAEMVRLNVEAVVHLCRALVPPMAERGEGAVLNVGSIASFQPLPGMSAYAGTKAFVLSFTAGLHAELRRSGVAVTALCPGDTRSEFASVAGGAAIADRLPRALSMSADDVAEHAIRGLEGNRWLVVPGRANALMALVGRHAPRGPLLRAAATRFG